MHRNKLAILSAALLAVCTFGVSRASASLIQENYRNPGDGLITYDSITGDSWLDAPVTMGESPDAALAANPGYALATLSQVEMLLDDAGIAPADVNAGQYYTSDEAAQNNLSVLLQITNFWVQYYGPEGSGWEYQGFGNVLDAAGTGWDQEDLDTRNPPLGSDGAYSSYVAFGNCLACSSSNNFDFLVETSTATATPEPASAVMFGGGLMLIGLWRRRRG